METSSNLGEHDNDYRLRRPLDLAGLLLGRGSLVAFQMTISPAKVATSSLAKVISSRSA
jgi:hypothetical protein